MKCCTNTHTQAHIAIRSNVSSLYSDKVKKNYTVTQKVLIKHIY
jgi:hypothetical protein